MLRGLDDPDEEDAAGGDGTVCEPVDEVAHKGDLVGDADAAGEHHDGAVGVQNVRAAVGSFDNGVDDNGAVRFLFGFLEELVCEAGAAADDEGHRGALGCEDVEVTRGDAFLGVQMFFRVAPRDGERMRGP